MPNKPTLTGTELRDSYIFWEESDQIQAALKRLRLQFPGATELDLRNHIMNFTLVKLASWLLPEDNPESPKEPWQ